MAACTAAASTVVPSLSAAKGLEKSSFVGASLPSLPARSPSIAARTLVITANSVKKINVKEPLGPSGELKFRNGKDSQGQKGKGLGTYQFVKKYGANVDGYSPIWAPSEWSKTGDTYAGGAAGLALWAVTLGAVLLGGVLLVYQTSALN
eukprot:TRINITY_DN4143_c0_g1_i1.p1 TRINITY_DN4143_c0_g1~~TRINITY_DN4143_c0_g1_i1.p1  ORF type:complete len:149 (+),score=34.10 TRINITY_DN4143_c0_g1_i1:171-617(+)